MAVITPRTPQNSSDNARMSKSLKRLVIKFVGFVSAALMLFSGYIAIVFAALNRMYDAAEVGAKPVYLPDEITMFVTCTVASSVLMYKSFESLSKLLGSDSRVVLVLNLKSFRILVVITLLAMPINFYLAGLIFTIGSFILKFRPSFWRK